MGTRVASVELAMRSEPRSNAVEQELHAGTSKRADARYGAKFCNSAANRDDGARRHEWCAIYCHRRIYSR